VRGFPFCQDCIVAGVELLRHHSSNNPTNVLRRKSSPFIATLLSFVPGLGAAYNGQTSKAIVHFAIFASFFQMAVVTQGMPGMQFFILGVIGTWLFAAVDACRTAQLMRAGLSPDAEDDVIARRLYGNPFAWGTTLIIIGTLFLLHTMLGVTLPMKELLPVALVAIGAYMLFDYIRRGKASDRIVRFDSRRPPPSVVASTRPVDTTNFRTGETTQFARRDVTPFPFERRS
jgi:hypothetical protein